MNDASLPEESEAQRIGHNASKCFNANCPDFWRVHSLDGTDDAGFDYQVQVVQAGKYSDIFRLQLKGTQAPQLNVVGEFFSVTLKGRTLNYYDRVTEPILLVLCDLSYDLSKPINCPLYYIWIHEEIQRHRELNPISQSQASLTVRIPKKNVLTSSLDLSSDIDLHRRMFAAVKSLGQTVEEKLPAVGPEARADILQRISGGFSARDAALIEQMSAPVLTPWPEAPADTVPGKLKDVAQKLSAGLSSHASEKLREISKVLDRATNAERAEYWFLKGRCLSQESFDKEACEAYETAFRLSDQSIRYKTAWVEAELREKFEGISKSDFSLLKSFLTSKSPEEVALHARILSAEGLYIQAEDLLRTISRKDSLGTLAILKVMQSEWLEVVGLCDEGLALEENKDETKQLYYLLRARANFYLSMSSSLNFETGGIVPVFGPANLNVVFLNSAWKDVEKTVELMSAAGWPANVGYFADIWACTSMMLGKESIALRAMHMAARKRPREIGLQEALERVAMQCQEWEIALEANSNQLESGSQAIRRIILLYQAKQYSACVNIFEENLALILKSDEKYILCLSLVILAADEIMRTDIGEKAEELLQQEVGWEAEAAVIDYYRTISRNLLAKDEAKQSLIQQYLRLAKPKIVGHQLFHALDAFDIVEAEMCVEIANALRAEQQFSVEAELHLAQAYTTLGQWDTLLDLVDDALKRFTHINRFQAIRAFALDKLGHSADALEQLELIVHESKYDSVAVNAYINIAARSGFSAEAMALVEKLLGQETKPQKKFDLLRLLFSLLQMSDPHLQRAEEIAWRMGTYARQEIESEEGLFILAYITATLPNVVKSSDVRRKKFQERIVKFTEKFPSSKIFRVGKIADDSTPEELQSILEKMVGRSAEGERIRQKFFNQLEKGDVIIPFSWRPRNILNNVADVAALWEISKRAKRDSKQYRLNMAVGEIKAVLREDFGERIPIFDMITLLLLNDLKLFDLLFSIFPKIAISQKTLLELQRLATPMVGSWARAQCQSLIEVLRSNIKKIVQPVSNKKNDAVSEVDEINGNEEFLKDQRFFMYSDDGVIRSYSDIQAGLSMCTLDLLEIGERSNIVTSAESARLIAQLCIWNVDVVVQLKHLIEIVPEKVVTARSVDEVINIIHSDELSSALFEAIWNVRKPYIEIFSHVSTVISILLKDQRNTVQTISGIVGVWYSGARLRTDIGNTPPLMRLTQLIVSAATSSKPYTPSILKRLIQVYINLVSLEWGDRMEERHEADSIRDLAITVAEVDYEVAKSSDERLGTIFLTAFTDGTADQGYFSKAYDKKILNLKIQKSLNE